MLQTIAGVVVALGALYFIGRKWLLITALVVGVVGVALYLDPPEALSPRDRCIREMSPRLRATRPDYLAAAAIACDAGMQLDEERRARR